MMALRVASLIPSGTEIVSALGMAHTLIGRSHRCDYPPEVEALPVLTEPKVDPERPGRESDDALRAILTAGSERVSSRRTTGAQRTISVLSSSS